MHYLRSYRCVFDRPNWPMTGLAAAACEAVPVLGQIIFTGYALEKLQSSRRADDHGMPPFDVERAHLYLTRGTWPFIVQLIAVLPVLMVSLLALFILWVMIAEQRTAIAAPRLMLIALLPGSLLVFVLVSVVLAPLTLYVAVRQELTGAAVPFVQDFLARVGRETLLAQVFVTLTGLALMVLGFLLLFVPVFGAMALAHFAQYHLLGQLYDLYLQRGGAPIPVNPQVVAPSL
jgi:hypothetical protein